MEFEERPLQLHHRVSTDISSYVALQFDELLTQSFEVGQNSSANGLRVSYFDDFPIWRPGSSNGVSFFWFEDQRRSVVSMVGLRRCVLSLNRQDRVNVAMIGAVATLPASRGLGLAAKLMAEALSEAKKEKQAAVVLWDSSESTLYRRLGFCPFRSEYLFRLDSFVPEGQRHQRHEIERGWDDLIFQNLMDRASGIQYEYRDIDWYRRHKNTRWYWLKNGTECIASVAIHRGIDLKGIVHEWHGETAHLQELFSEVLKDEPGALLMGPNAPRDGIAFQKNEQGLILPIEPALKWQDWWFWGLDSA
jgi:GNAT superfamily N-acetyltransferase